jgi:hypothetical protein
MIIRPITIREADQFVEKYHRHNKKAGNGKCAIACFENDELIGVAIGGRPRSRHLDNGTTFEIYRVCTNGYRNSTSFLYSRIKRIAQLLGYLKIITYTLQSESGSSLKAIDAKIEKEVIHKHQWTDYKNIKRQIQEVTILPKFRWVL